MPPPLYVSLTAHDTQYYPPQPPSDMFSYDDAPYNAYAKRLLPLRHGYPLWHPEIERDRGLEVQIGDVGYLHKGAFIRLFNTTLPASHPGNARFGVPSGHEPFQISEISKREY